MVGVGWQRIRERASDHPYQLAVTLVAVPIGGLAIVFGARVSTAMSRTPLGEHFDVVRYWGAVMAVAGGSAVWGLLAERGWAERAGVLTLAGCFCLYGGTVLLGLGIGGLVAGPVTLALAAAGVGRLFGSLREEVTRTVRERLDGNHRRADTE